MSEIDRRRIAAVLTLEALDYTFRAGRWHPPDIDQEFNASGSRQFTTSRRRSAISMTARPPGQS
jgi:hypothetical protein